MLESLDKVVYIVLKQCKHFNTCLILTVGNVGDPAGSLPEYKRKPPGQRPFGSSDQGQDQKEEVEEEDHNKEDCREIPLQQETNLFVKLF